MGKHYNKVLKCIVTNCKQNSICPGCTGLTVQHLCSNIECKHYIKNWTSIPQNFKLKFKKICIKELKEQEIIQSSPKAASKTIEQQDKPSSIKAYKFANSNLRVVNNHSRSENPQNLKKIINAVSTEKPHSIEKKQRKSQKAKTKK